MFKSLYDTYTLPDFNEIIDNYEQIYETLNKEDKNDDERTLLKENEEYGRNEVDSDEELFKQKEEEELKRWEKFCKENNITEKDLDDMDSYNQNITGYGDQSKQAREEQDEEDELTHRIEIVSEKIRLKEKVVKHNVYSRGQKVREHKTFDEAIQEDFFKDYDKVMEDLDEDDLNNAFEDAKADYEKYKSFLEREERISKEDINRYENQKEEQFSEKFKNRKF